MTNENKKAVLDLIKNLDNLRVELNFLNGDAERISAREQWRDGAEYGEQEALMLSRHGIEDALELLEGALQDYRYIIDRYGER